MTGKKDRISIRHGERKMALGIGIRDGTCDIDFERKKDKRSDGRDKKRNPSNGGGDLSCLLSYALFEMK